MQSRGSGGSLARAVTVDNELVTKTRPLHTLNVVRKPKKHRAIFEWNDNK